MQTPATKYRLLSWIIVILLATNLATIGSFYYHRTMENRQPKTEQNEQQNIPGEQRTRFFREQLALSDEQLEQFREINRTFNRIAKHLEMNLAGLREEMIEELGSQSPDTIRLGQIAAEVGSNHRQLKQVTATFYLDMKRICTPAQQEKLHELFKAMLNKENQINLPQTGKGKGRWENRSNNHINN
ncbi:MAG: Spy/CpxP family protein refolding chaperone [Mangrovibacterium sp.]